MRENGIKAFLYIATRNVCYNHLASSEAKRKSDQALEEDVLKGIMAPGADILTSIIHTELVQEVAALVDRLPELQAKVFRMSYFDDLCTEEICKELSTTAGTVYFARSKALKALKSAATRRRIISVLLFVTLYSPWCLSKCW